MCWISTRQTRESILRLCRHWWSAGYLRGIPKDPFTGATTTWQEISDPVEKGVVDVFSGAEFVGTDGTPYNRW